MSITKNTTVTKIAAGFVGLALALSLAYAVPANAQTIEDLTAQINALLVTISSLQVQLAVLSGGSPAVGSCNFTRDLTVDVSGDDVVCLQDYLTGTGHFTFSGGSTGFFGPITRSAVAAWQVDNNVSPPAGYFGPISTAKYNSLVASVPSTPGTPSTPSVGTGLAVSSTAQPSNTLAPDSASRVPFTNFVVTAGSDGDVTLESVTVERVGLSANAVFAGIVLLDSDGTQFGLSKTLNSNNQARVGDDVVIRAGTSRTFTIAGNMAADNSARDGQVVALNVIALNTSATVSGSLPIVGASHTVNASLAIGSITALRGALDPNVNSTNKEVGTTGFTFSAVKFTAGSVEDIRLMSFRWNQSSSASNSDIDNIVIVVDGVEYPTVISADGDYYSANFPGGVLIEEGLTKEVSIKGDITDGSNRGVDFDIFQNTDAFFVGETFGYGIIPTASGNRDTSNSSTDDSLFNETNAGASSGSPWYDGRETSIGTGSLTVSSTNDVPAQLVANGATAVNLGSFKFDVNGEALSWTTITLTIATNTGGGGEQITNVSLVDANGSILAGPQDPNAAGNTVVLSDTVTLPVGENIIFVKGTLDNDWETNDTIVFKFTPSSNITSLKGEVTGQTITATPAALVSAKTQTVSAATVTVSPSASLVSQNIINNSNGAVIGRYVIDASASGEDVRITTMQFEAVTGAQSNIDDYNTIQVFDGETALNTGSNVVNPSGHSDNTDFLVSVTLDSPGLIVPKGTTKLVELRANVNDPAVGGTPTIVLDFADGTLVSAWTITGQDTGTTVSTTLSINTGATMTVVANGTLTATISSADPTEKWYVSGEKQTVGIFRFTGTNEPIAITDLSLVLDTASSSSADIVSIHLFDGGTEILSKLSPFSSANTETFDLPAAGPLAFIIPQDDDKDLTVKVVFASIGTSKPGSSGSFIKLATTTTATDHRALGAESGSSNNILGSAGTTTGARYFNSLPTLARVNVSNTILGDGTQELYRFTATADPSDEVAIYKFSFTVATTGAFADTFKLTEVETGKVVNSNIPTLAGVVELIVSNGSYGSDYITIPEGTTYTYRLEGVVTGAGNSGDSVRIFLNDDASAVAHTVAEGVMESATGVDGDNNDNFIWSPVSTTSAALDNDDWINGFKVPGIESDNLGTQVISNI